jgi:two-component sensor histidine kinase
MRTRLNSLRARMALILGAVLLVPFAYAVFQTVHAYVQERARLLETLDQTARLISANQADFFAETRRLLEELAGTDEIEGTDDDACAARLIDTLGRSLKYGNFAVTDQAGAVRCSSTPVMLGLPLTDRSWFQSVRAGAKFTVSEVLNGRDGKGRTVVAAASLHTGDGAFRGALAASIDLALLDARMGDLSLPKNAAVFLVDQRGEPLLRDSGAGAGVPSTPRTNTPALARPADAATAEQVERRYAKAVIEGTPLSVVVGLPAPDQWFWMDRNLIAGLFGPILMLAVALSAVWIGIDLLVNRHIAALARTARAYSGGHFGARPKVGGAPTELRELGEAFARMAERIRAREGELKASLEQKDVLLREIHHRVKNNLQIVTSLLNLRARAIGTPAAKAALHEAQTRITALALVYRFLYEHNDLDVVDLDLLVRELSDLLGDSAGPGDGRLALEVQTAPVQLETARAISIALWLTEAITNAYGHAFPDGRRGTVKVTLRHGAGDHVELEVQDDGIGMPPELARLEDTTTASANATLGLTLIRMLAKQIGGLARFEGPPGTRAVLVFPRQNTTAHAGTSEPS